jgi:hypothetical protein
MRFKLAKLFFRSVDSSKVVIFIPHTESSRAYNNSLAHSLSEYAGGPEERKLLTMD